MEDEKIIELIKPIINTQEGFRFFSILLEKLGAFGRGCNLENTNLEYFNRGRREKGLWLLELVKQANWEKYTSIERNRR